MLKNSKNSLVLAAVIIATVVFAIPQARAQTTLEEVSGERTQLQKQLTELEKQISQYQTQLSKIKGQKNTLANKISELKAKQQILNAQIRISSLQLTDLESLEQTTAASIELNRTKNLLLRDELADLIFLLNREEARPLFYDLILSDNLSEALSTRTNYLQTSDQLGGKAIELSKLRAQLLNDMQTINTRREAQEKTLSIQAIQQNKLIGSVTEQNTLLKETKGKETKYQAELTDTKKEVAAIKNRLYQLLEVSKQITFGQAVTIAQWAGSQTGVRAAFLLAILTQESSLGKNVGTCNRAGDPASKSWKVVMKPDRDQEPFKKITSELGLPIDTTPVSCPMKDKKGNQLGWGGAMGPAQFIPSTWMGYKSKITAITGKTANPWDIRDAFLAAAIKLKADGAGTQSGEWTAAMKYFSGGTNPAYRFYGDNVVATAAEYAADIAKLK